MLLFKVTSPELPNLIDIFPLSEENQFPQIIDALGRLNLSWSELVQFELTGLDYRKNLGRKMVFNPNNFPKPFSLYEGNTIIMSFSKIEEAFKDK